jgi:hypothetical protein
LTAKFAQSQADVLTTIAAFTFITTSAQQAALIGTQLRNLQQFPANNRRCTTKARQREHDNRRRQPQSSRSPTLRQTLFNFQISTTHVYADLIAGEQPPLRFTLRIKLYTASSAL